MNAHPKPGGIQVLNFAVRAKDWPVILIGTVVTLIIALAVGYPLAAIQPHIPDFGVTYWFGWVSAIKHPLETATLEELLFRGLLFGWIRRVMHLELAALLSTIIFALFHIPMGIAEVAFAVILGYVLAKAYARTNSITVAIGIHFLVIIAGMYLLKGA